MLSAKYLFALIVIIAFVAAYKISKDEDIND